MQKRTPGRAGPGVLHYPKSNKTQRANLIIRQAVHLSVWLICLHHFQDG
ncbi:hypothetical protein LTSEMIN_4840 [Salmonella enterica subsp. enterica serovar Minnesota str. A4-603]|nr:hypothetical protein LTSEMIN_4840 [Salmonella enterica subsp. enterica serovar Minnesota str. A4-603]